MSSENICERENPCMNNGTCVYDKLKKNYYCECVDGFMNKNCSELDGNFLGSFVVEGNFLFSVE
jgi:hypothetical protein